MADGGLVAAGVDGGVGRLEQRVDGVTDDRRLHAVDRARARPAARRPWRRGGRRRRSLSHRPAITAATPAWRWARTRLVSVWYATSRTTSLRNCHRLPSTLEQARSARSSSRSATWKSWPIAWANRASAPIELGRPEDGGVVEDRPLRRRQLVDAGGDEGPQRAGQLGRVGRSVAASAGQLDEEQRVAAAAVDERLDRAIVVVDAVALARGCRGPARGCPRARAGRAAPAARAAARPAAATPCRRRAAAPVTSRNGQVAQRAHDDGQLVAQRRVGPLQVVHPQHRHAGLGVAPQHLGERAGDGVAGAGRVEPVERRRVAEQEDDASR